MPRDFSKNNLSSVIDIKKPESSASKTRPSFKKIGIFSAKTHENRRSFEPKKVRKNQLADKKFKKIFFLTIVIFALGGGIIVFSLYDFHNQVVDSLKNNIGLFEESASRFDPLNPDFFNLNREKNILPTPSPLVEFGSKIIPILKESVGAYKTFQEIVGNTFLLLQKSSSLFDKIPALVFGQRGGELIGELEDISNIIADIDSKNSSLATQTSKLKNFSDTRSDLSLPIQIEIGRLNKFLAALVVWLKEPKDHHLLVLLENPAEMRPTGGFIGSFADITLKNGNIAIVNVHDINDADRELDLKTIPPKPVQAIVTNWRAADANWFFDFPASARKVKYFIESSNLYQGKIAFDGVIAVSHNVVRDLLSLTGPIEISDEKVVIDKDNFLTEIQRQVQENRMNKDSYPKRILQKITPVLFERLASLSEENRKNFTSFALNWVEKKDVRIVLEDEKLESFMEAHNLSGRAYSISQGFYGDYLAVSNANLGGSKTDLFIDQKITLESQINEDGTVSDRLKIERKHSGNKSKFSWYNTTNQSYIRVYVSAGSRLDNHSGSISKIVKPKINYASSGYTPDEDVSKIESTERDLLSYPNVKMFKESEKDVFGFWSKVDPGKTATITLDYVHRLPTPPTSGRKYTFVFDKQPGINGSYKFEIGAPVGYYWKENNLPIFEYSSLDIPGQVVFELTLSKIK